MATNITTTGTMPPAAQQGPSMTFSVSDSTMPFLASLAISGLYFRQRSLYSFGIALGCGLMPAVESILGVSQAKFTGLSDSVVLPVIAAGVTWYLLK